LAAKDLPAARNLIPALTVFLPGPRHLGDNVGWRRIRAQDRTPSRMSGDRMSQTVPITLVDGQGFLWDIQGDGRIRDGTDDAFDSGLDSPDLRFVTGVTTEMSGRQVVLSPGTAASNPNIVLERRVYVPETEGWARFIDTATNTSDQPITYRSGW